MENGEFSSEYIHFEIHSGVIINGTRRRCMMNVRWYRSGRYESNHKLCRISCKMSIKVFVYPKELTSIAGIQFASGFVRGYDDVSELVQSTSIFIWKLYGIVSQLGGTWNFDLNFLLNFWTLGEMYLNFGVRCLKMIWQIISEGEFRLQKQILGEFRC